MPTAHPMSRLMCPSGGVCTADTRLRARHVQPRAHTMYIVMYIPVRAVVHPFCLNTGQSPEVVMQQRLTSPMALFQLFRAGLRNPAQTANPALTRRRSVLQHNELQRSAGLPGYDLHTFICGKVCTRKSMYIAHIEVAGKKPGLPG